MALITLDEAKTFLGIDNTDTENDNAISQLIPKAESLFCSLIKVDSLELNTKDEIVIFDSNLNALRFKNFPVNSINSINGVVYTGQEWEDYLVSKNEVKILQPDFLNQVKLNRIKINYTYGFSVIPEDLKLAILILVSGFYNIKENYGTTTCKIWQESISFRDITESEDFTRIVKTYKKKFIFVI